LPVVSLGRLLGQQRESLNGAESLQIVVLTNGKSRLGVVVDRLFSRGELFVKDIHPQLAALPGVGGASILGNGRVVLILDGEDLFRLAEKTAGSEALLGHVDPADRRHVA